MKRIFPIALVAIFLVSCATAPIMVKVQSSKSSTIALEQLNLASTMIGPLFQPDLPLIDAASFNGKTNKIADVIMDEEERMIEEFKYILTSTLKGHLSSSVKTIGEFDGASIEPYQVEKGLKVDNKNFPVVFFSEGDLNIADLGKGKNVNKIFKNDEGIKDRVREIAQALDISNVAVSYNRLGIVGVGAFGSFGMISLESYLFIYDSQGDLLINIKGWTKPEQISGKNSNEYVIQLHKFEGLADEISRKLNEYIQNS
ncbi:hypothetical protein KZP23_05725 [Echinicola marina]|uniref:hypothetical protein n=1 Tax=Echinicola marina TaxID=2859768 RepID=UPI001CF7070B|nr:hypothetical protein [Echinicola marina]UCS94521.1 hypothetical protein KZP23_05725 [Echinicola marina]